MTGRWDSMSLDALCEIASTYADSKFLSFELRPYAGHRRLGLQEQRDLQDGMAAGDVEPDFVASVVGYHSGGFDAPDPSDLASGRGPSERAAVEQLLDRLANAGHLTE